jgi:putative sterol carrier protein
MATTGKKNDAGADPIGRFFTELADRGSEPLLKSATGTLRFDLTDGKRVERWFVAITKGDLDVSHKNAAADAVVRADRDLFEGMVTGRVNGMAALLRGVLVVEGDLGLIALFARVFPGPPRSRVRDATPKGKR